MASDIQGKLIDAIAREVAEMRAGSTLDELKATIGEAIVRTENEEAQRAAFAGEGPSLETRLEIAVLNIIAVGRARCGDGFGKYPLGTLDAVQRLLPLVDGSERVAKALQDFEERLKQ